MNVYAINGIALAGKDSFVERVQTHAKNSGKMVCVLSTIDPVKVIYRVFFGWNGDKSPIHRKNLNILKRIWIETSNGPYNWMVRQLQTLNADGVHSTFVMVREYEEMMGVVKAGHELFNNGETITIIRDGIPIPPIEQEFIDSHPENYVYDWSIPNRTTDDPNIPDLWAAAKAFWDITNKTVYSCDKRVWDANAKTMLGGIS